MELVVEDFTQKKGRLGGMGYMVWSSLAKEAKSGSAVISREPNLSSSLTIYRHKHYCLTLSPDVDKCTKCSSVYSFTICISHTHICSAWLAERV